MNWLILHGGGGQESPLLMPQGCGKPSHEETWQRFSDSSGDDNFSLRMRYCTRFLYTQTRRSMMLTSWDIERPLVWSHLTGT